MNDIPGPEVNHYVERPFTDADIELLGSESFPFSTELVPHSNNENRPPIRMELNKLTNYCGI